MADGPTHPLETVDGSRSAIPTLKAETRVRISLGPPSVSSQKDRRKGGRKRRISESVAAFIGAEYRQVLAARMGRDTWVRERAILDAFAAQWGHLPLADVSVQAVETWWAGFGAQNAPATANKYLYRLKHLFRTAIRWGLVGMNPAEHLRRLKEPRGRVVWLTDEQRQTLMDAAPDWLRAYAILSRETGARLGMVCALTRGSVDFTKGLVTYPTSKNGEPHCVPITDRLAKLFIELGTARLPADAFVLPRVHRSSVGRAWHRLCIAHGVRGFTFHDLLHDGCTALAASGASQRAIMAYRGHLSPSMSVRYTHISAGTLRDVLEKGLG